MTDLPPNVRLKDGVIADTRPWIDRMAESLSKVCANSSECSYALMKGALEAAGEIKCIRLKTLLAEAQQMIWDAAEFGDAPKVPGDFHDRVNRELWG